MVPVRPDWLELPLPNSLDRGKELRQDGGRGECAVADVGGRCVQPSDQLAAQID